jgi:hypothetical protein
MNRPKRKRQLETKSKAKTKRDLDPVLELQRLTVKQMRRGEFDLPPCGCY